MSFSLYLLLFFLFQVSVPEVVAVDSVLEGAAEAEVSWEYTLSMLRVNQRDLVIISKISFSNSLYRIVAKALAVNLLWDKC